MSANVRKSQAAQMAISRRKTDERVRTKSGSDKRSLLVLVLEPGLGLGLGLAAGPRAGPSNALCCRGERQK